MFIRQRYTRYTQCVSSAASDRYKRQVEVKDIVLTELQELSIEDVKQSEAREGLRQRLISAISQIFPSKPEWEDPEPIRKVLFEEFVIQ